MVKFQLEALSIDYEDPLSEIASCAIVRRFRGIVFERSISGPGRAISPGGGRRKWKKVDIWVKEAIRTMCPSDVKLGFTNENVPFGNSFLYLDSIP